MLYIFFIFIKKTKIFLWGMISLFSLINITILWGMVSIFINFRFFTINLLKGIGVEDSI